MAPSIVNVTAASTQPANSLAGTYLAGNFAAAQGDLKAATNFYSSTLKDAPDNADLLERTFLFAAEGGDIDRAIALSPRVLAVDADNRPAHLVSQIGAVRQQAYAAALTAPTAPANGWFASVTRRIVEAWSRAWPHESDGPLAAPDAL